MKTKKKIKMKTSKIGYWVVSNEILETVKRLVSENNMFEIMDMFPDEWNIGCERLDRIDIDEKSVTFIDRGLQTSDGTEDGSWGIKIR